MDHLASPTTNLLIINYTAVPAPALAHFRSQFVQHTTTVQHAQSQITNAEATDVTLPWSAGGGGAEELAAAARAGAKRLDEQGEGEGREVLDFFRAPRVGNEKSEEAVVDIGQGRRSRSRREAKSGGRNGTDELKLKRDLGFAALEWGFVRIEPQPWDGTLWTAQHNGPHDILGQYQTIRRHDAIRVLPPSPSSSQKKKTSISIPPPLSLKEKTPPSPSQLNVVLKKL